MAGFIHIDAENGLSVGSVAFNAITELTRPYVKKNSKEYISEIYAPLDEGGLDIISLTEQGIEGFNSYYRGVRSAYEECVRSSKCGELDEQYFDMVIDSWKELIDLLEGDDRLR